MDFTDPRLPLRFWAKVVTQPNEDPRLNDCWLWDAAVDGDGYGRFGVRTGPGEWLSARAHRVAYATVKGWDVFGLELNGEDIHHLCHTRLCVRPDHLRRQPHAAHGFHHGKHRNNHDLCTRSRYCMCHDCCDEREALL